MKKRDFGRLNSMGPSRLPIWYDSASPTIAQGMSTTLSITMSSLSGMFAAVMPASTSSESPGRKKTSAPVSKKMISASTWMP